MELRFGYYFHAVFLFFLNSTADAMLPRRALAERNIQSPANHKAQLSPKSAKRKKSPRAHQTFIDPVLQQQNPAQAYSVLHDGLQEAQSALSAQQEDMQRKHPWFTVKEQSKYLKRYKHAIEDRTLEINRILNDLFANIATKEILYAGVLEEKNALLRRLQEFDDATEERAQDLEEHFNLLETLKTRYATFDSDLRAFRKEHRAMLEDAEADDDLADKISSEENEIAKNFYEDIQPLKDSLAALEAERATHSQALLDAVNKLRKIAHKLVEEISLAKHALSIFERDEEEIQSLPHAEEYQRKEKELNKLAETLSLSEQALELEKKTDFSLYRQDLSDRKPLRQSYHNALERLPREGVISKPIRQRLERKLERLKNPASPL